MVTISGCIERGSMTLRVCAEVEEERVMSGVWFEGGMRLVRSIGEGNESKLFMFGMGDGVEQTDTRGDMLLLLLVGFELEPEPEGGGFRIADWERERVGGGGGMCKANC